MTFQRICYLSACFIAFNLIVINCIQGQTPTLKIGQKAPQISVLTIEGKPFKLTDLHGKIVLIDFWASWCGPCVKEQPLLKSIYEKYSALQKAGKFEIIGVSFDKSRADWLRTVNRQKITWPQVSDLKYWKSSIAKNYGIQLLPFNVIIDGQGTIIALNLHGKELEQFLEQKLN
ncbi:MAG: TlpA family protein disulfide reductase [Saprospiraceae bacterium]|nr:TlpA family protein disulfide reductase [Saprospiraceae bacterium]